MAYDCPACHDIESWCAACGGTSSAAAMMSTASCRGAYWAEDVARAMASSPACWPPWPAFDASARVRVIAVRKVVDLGGDERTRSILARSCCEAAKRRWEELCAEVSAGRAV